MSTKRIKKYYIVFQTEKEFTKLNTEMHRTGQTYEKTEYRKRFEDEWA